MLIEESNVIMPQKQTPQLAEVYRVHNQKKMNEYNPNKLF
jgi:hypothetical protein